ncbi:hypothetical protein [Sphingorhabdus sp.]|jgi:hypothetical protein|uniref:hypothetical protein n=1 Tax=Sphingorhabdus sp. TaxID=1902408 RepID=UPI003D81695D
MIEAQQFWTPQNEWQAKLKAFEDATNDLESDDIKSDQMIDYYAEAATAALTDFLLHPVDSPTAILAKMAVMKSEEVYEFNSGNFDKIWTALIEDMKRISSAPPSPQ